MTTDKMRTITSVEAQAPSSLLVTWSDGTRATIDLAGVQQDDAFASLRNSSEFNGAEIGDWGHSIVWPAGAELGADTLWLETLAVLRKNDAQQFLEWRLRHGLSLSKAAEALGLSRRMVAYYSNAEKPIPRHILLACRGWEADQTAPRRSDRKPDERHILHP